MKGRRGRWWLAGPLILVAAGWGVSVWRGHERTAGEELLEKLELRCGPMRGALMVLDYAPDPSELAALRQAPLEPGEGAPFGGLTHGPLGNQGREQSAKATLDGVAVEFFWRRDRMLRQAVAEGGAGWSSMAAALSDAHYYSEAARGHLAEAAGEMGQWSDEELLLAWLHADRAVMAEQTDLTRGVREGMLLAARPNEGPAIVFSSGPQRVYLLPMDQPAAARAGALWVRMEGYENGLLQWNGALRIAGSPEPRQVRLFAARLAEAAAAAPPSAP